jgi:hypothetical protein
MYALACKTPHWSDFPYYAYVEICSYLLQTLQHLLQSVSKKSTLHGSEKMFWPINRLSLEATSLTL